VKDGCSDQSWSTLLPTLLAELLACHSRKPGTWESNLSLCMHVHTHSSHVWIIMFLHGAFSWKNLSWFYQSLSLSLALYDHVFAWKHVFISHSLSLLGLGFRASLSWAYLWL
jgi:hypothetical protein